MENITLSPEVNQSIQEAENLLVETKTYQIVNQEQLNFAAKWRNDIKDRAKRLEEERLAITRPIDESKKRIMDLFRKPLECLEQAEKLVSTAILTFNREQIRKQEAEQARLRAEAEEVARKEREKIEAQALKQLEKGNEEKAEVLIEKAEAVQVFVPIVAPMVEKPKDISIKTTWKAKVVNPQDVPAYLNGMELRTINMVVLNQIARSSNGNTTIPGVVFEKEETLADARRNSA